MPAEGKPLVVLQSFPAPRPTTNPYIVMLKDALDARPDVELHTFGWRTAFLRRPDVFHVHWPDLFVVGTSPGKALVKQLAFLAMLVKFRLTGTAIVRTMHNVERTRATSSWQHWLLGVFDRWTALRVTINDSTRPDGPQQLILHGHFRDWYAGRAEPDSIPGRIAFVGLVRRYKNVVGLVEAFRELADPGASLHVAGNPSSPELAAAIAAAAAGDRRIRLELHFLDEDAFVEAVGQAELVVLPYLEMHNSGVVLTAVSLGRPVLVPENEVNAKLALEFGPGWIHTYAGALSGAKLQAALAASREPRHPPDLTGRDWTRAAALHIEAYRRAVGLVCRYRRPALGEEAAQ